MKYGNCKYKRTELQQESLQSSNSFKMNLLFVIGCLLVWTFPGGECDEATLYDDSEYRGKEIKISIGNCKNTMDMDFNDKTSSIKTPTCIRLWQHSDCRGKSLDIMPPGNSNLERNKFNDELTSVSECKKFGGVSDDVEVVMDIGEAPDLKDYAEMTQRRIREWFPFMQNLMASPAYQPLTKIIVKFSKEDGIGSNGNYIQVSANYLRRNPNDWGLFIHEMTHILHKASNCPGWIVEGMAEWIRRFFYEQQASKKPPKGTKFNDNDGKWLLDYMNVASGRPVIYNLNKACEDGSYYDGIVKDLTGKTEREWFDQMINDDSFPYK